MGNNSLDSFWTIAIMAVLIKIAWQFQSSDVGRIKIVGKIMTLCSILLVIGLLDEMHFKYLGKFFGIFLYNIIVASIGICYLICSFVSIYELKRKKYDQYYRHSNIQKGEYIIIMEPYFPGNKQIVIISIVLILIVFFLQVELDIMVLIPRNRNAQLNYCVMLTIIQQGQKYQKKLLH